MRPKFFDIDPADVDPDGLADGNSSAGATVTLDGALTSGGTFTSADGLAHRLDIIDLGADDQTGATYTITGTDADDKAQVENIAGPGASATIETTKYFKTVSSIAIASPVAASTVDIGTVDEVSYKTLPIDNYKEVAPTVQVQVTGTINFDIETTLESPFKALDDQSDLDWINDGNFTGKTASISNSLASPGNRAMKVVINSYTNGAELQVYVTQPN